LQSIVIEDFDEQPNTRLNRSFETAMAQDTEKYAEAETKSAVIRHTKFSDSKKKNARSSSLTKDLFTENRLALTKNAYKDIHSKLNKAKGSKLNVSMSDKKGALDAKEKQPKEEIVGRVMAFSDVTSKEEDSQSEASRETSMINEEQLTASMLFKRTFNKTSVTCTSLQVGWDHIKDKPHGLKYVLEYGVGMKLNGVEQFRQI